MIRKLILVVAGVSLLLLGVGIYRQPSYRKYKETRALRHATEFAKAGDVANAVLSARQVLRLNPSSVPACQMLAELAERAHSPAAVEWRQKVAELQPTVPNLLALAAAVLRFQQPPYVLAERAL